MSQAWPVLCRRPPLAFVARGGVGARRAKRAGATPRNPRKRARRNLSGAREDVGTSGDDANAPRLSWKRAMRSRRRGEAHTGQHMPDTSARVARAPSAQSASACPRGSECADCPAKTTAATRRRPRRKGIWGTPAGQRAKLVAARIYRTRTPVVARAHPGPLRGSGQLCDTSAPRAAPLEAPCGACADSQIDRGNRQAPQP